MVLEGSEKVRPLSTRASKSFQMSLLRLLCFACKTGR